MFDGEIVKKKFTLKKILHLKILAPGHSPRQI